ncbi:MAG: hypothetical protein E6J45_01600, partial [Chloroflexi bacterium]
MALLALCAGTIPLLLLVSRDLLPARADTVLATDTFARTVSNGWGSADVGGAWTILDSASTWSVAPGTGSITTPANAQARGILEGAVAQDVDLLAEIALPRCASNCDAFLVGRASSDSAPSYYRVGVVQSTSGGNVSIRAQRGDGTLISGDVNTGIAAADGVVLWLRVQMQGVYPTAIRARAWLAGSSEPASWTLNATDGNAAQQISGAVGVRVRIEDTTAAHTVRCMSYQASVLSSPPPTPTPSGTPTPTPVSGTFASDGFQRS